MTTEYSHVDVCYPVLCNGNNCFPISAASTEVWALLCATLFYCFFFTKVYFCVIVTSVL